MHGPLTEKSSGQDGGSGGVGGDGDRGGSGGDGTEVTCETEKSLTSEATIAARLSRTWSAGAAVGV